MGQERGITTVFAIVRAVEGKEALLEVEAGGCGRCHEEGGCGGQQLTQMFCSGPKTYRLENGLGASVGDRVQVAIAQENLRRSANLAYVLPLTVALLAAVLGDRLAGESGAIAGLLGGLAAALAYLRWRLRAGAGKIAGRPYIVSRSHSNQEACRS